jgi:Spy/CpxP family protein refolding chaperone
MIRAMGPAGALLRAAFSLDLKPEQKATLDKIAADLRDQPDAGARAEMKEFHSDLVTGVKAGKLDAAKLEAHQAALEKTAKAHHEKEAEALAQLHAALEPEQRKTLASNVRAAEDKRAARIKAHERPDAARTSPARARLEAFTKDLDLDAEQQKKLQGMLPKDDGKDPREEARKQLESTLTAFEKDTFDAKKAELGDAKARTKPIGDQIKFFAQLVPVLTPAQREKVSSRLERTSEAGGPDGRRRGFPRPGDDDDNEP